MKLKAKDIPGWRLSRLEHNKGLCALCNDPCVSPVGDHNHKSGKMRDVICRSCNSALGAIERTTRYGIKDILKFAIGAAKYLELHNEDQTGILHPTHKEPGYKKKVRNKKSIEDKQKMTRARATMKREAKVSAKL